MKEKLQYLWGLFQKGAFFIGNIISTVFMVVFYFSLLAIVAVPARKFGKYFHIKSSGSNWVAKQQTKDSLEDFRHE
jgi:hypothetical protein